MAQGRLEHANISVTDPDRSAALLMELLGWEERWRGASQLGGRSVHVGAEHDYIALYTGDQVKGGPGWATQNSGIMLHSQDPKTMGKDQDFPCSLEFQLLGKGNSVKTTGNLCTPGTYITLDGKVNKTHCMTTKFPTLPLGEWVKAEAEVRGGKLVKHLINGQEVMQYTDLKLDEGDANAKPLIEIQGNNDLTEGYISLQSESHPVEFRNIEVMELKD